MRAELCDWFRFVRAEWTGRQDHGWAIVRLMAHELRNGIIIVMEGFGKRGR